MVEFNRRIPYNVVINPSINNGFVVRVGCAELHYQSVEAMLGDIKDYLVDPDRTIRAYNQAMEVPSDAPDAPRPAGLPDPPECTGVFEERPHAVALCRCGAGLDAMGRCVQGPYERGGSGSGPIPRGAERLGRSPR